MEKKTTKKTTTTKKVDNKEIKRLSNIFVNEIKNLHDYFNQERKDLQAHYNQEITSLRNKNANLSAELQQQIKSTESIFINSDKRVRNTGIVCLILCAIMFFMGYFVRGL